MAKCRSCDAEIVWAVSEAGKRMPLDAKPFPGGNVEMIGADAAGTPVARVLSPGAPNETGADRHVSHFATCAQAGSWRRR